MHKQKSTFLIQGFYTKLNYKGQDVKFNISNVINSNFYTRCFLLPSWLQTKYRHKTCMDSITYAEILRRRHYLIKKFLQNIVAKYYRLKEK